MRRSSLIAVLFSGLAVACVATGGRAAATRQGDFMSWAHEKSSEFDRRWSIIADSGAAPADSSLSEGAKEITGRLSASERIVLGSRLSHSIISSRSFFHKAAQNAAFLPLSTRRMGDATRGMNMLSDPARARSPVPCDVKRPLNSAVQQKSFIPKFGDVSRPRLNSFGRIGSTSRLHRAGTSHPTTRADRPRLL
jgi:hypothetical protein